MRRDHFFLISLIIVFSCSEKRDYIYTQKENRVVFENKFKLTETDTISFPLNNTSSFWHYSTGFNRPVSDTTYYFSFLNDFDKSIVYYDLDRREINKIVLQKYGENGVGFLPPNSTHFFDGPNDVFVYNQNSGILFLVDSIGNVKNKFEIVDYDIVEDIPFPEPSGINPFMIIEGDAYFSCGLDKPQKDYTGYGMVLKYNLESRKSEYIIPFPDIYNKAFWGSAFKYLTNFAYNKHEKTLILNYPISPFIYQSDLKGKVFASAYVGSEYFDKIVPMYSDINYAFEENRDFEEEDMFSLSNSDFPKIMYDSHKNMYYRIAYVRPSIDDVKNGNQLTDFSIIILDENFVKLGETRFSSQVYDNWMISTTDYGILIARKDLYGKNENRITFSIFNISEI